MNEIKVNKTIAEETGDEISTTMSEQGILTIQGIRCYEKDGVVFLNLEDVARGLGFTRIAASGNEVVRWERVEGYLRGIGFVPTCGHGEGEPYIPENIFYRLCMKGKNEAAEAFQAKVADEVIPSIRKHGAYLTDSATEALFNDPETFAKLAVKWADERKARLAAEQTVAQQQEKIESDAPKVLFADSVSSSQTEILVGELAKILKQNGMDIGQNRLFDQLRRDGYLVSRKGTDYNMPTQKSMELGLMRIKETTVTHADGHVTISKTPKVLGKGQVYFVNKYAGSHLH